MCEEEYNEGNKLIAEFMGLEKNDFGYWVNKDYLFGAQLKLFDFELKFHSSWDWLMPVIRRIIDTIGVKTINECDSEEWFQSTRITKMYIGIDINLSHYYVVEFIKWYNSCQKEK